jgi:deoxyribonuclease-4
MNLGAHMSIAGGLPKALERGKAVGCSVVQIFLKNQVQWRGKPLLNDEIREFKRLREETGILIVFAHATYLINLAAPERGQWERSVNAFHDELERAEALGLPYVVIHPGSHKGSGLDAGIGLVATALDELCGRTRGYRVMVLLENTAGAGNTVGAKFSELRAILDRVSSPDRIGICLDTCHLFAAGYDIRTREGYEAAMSECEATVGIKTVRVIHLNDAKKGLGSGLDRHQHIGQGEIGLEAFRCLLNDQRFAGLPMAIETPKEPEPEADLRNLALLRSLKA